MQSKEIQQPIEVKGYIPLIDNWLIVLTINTVESKKQVHESRKYE